MEDQNFGQKCSICKTRDYIPFECKNCQRKLCNDHFWDPEHKCRFIGNSLKAKPQSNNNKKQYLCGICKIKLTTVNHFYCQKCDHLFCLKHRLSEVHSCESQKSKCQLI